MINQYNNNQKHGIWEEEVTTPYGQEKHKGEYINGLREGKWSETIVNTLLSVYVNSFFNSEEKKYGDVIWNGEYIKGKKHGVWIGGRNKEIYEMGVLESSYVNDKLVQLNKNGKMVMLIIGTIVYEWGDDRSYTKTRLDGVKEYFDKNGNFLHV